MPALADEEIANSTAASGKGHGARVLLNVYILRPLARQKTTRPPKFCIPLIDTSVGVQYAHSELGKCQYTHHLD